MQDKTQNLWLTNFSPSTEKHTPSTHTLISHLRSSLETNLSNLMATIEFLPLIKFSTWVHLNFGAATSCPPTNAGWSCFWISITVHAFSVCCFSLCLKLTVPSAPLGVSCMHVAPSFSSPCYTLVGMCLWSCKVHPVSPACDLHAALAWAFCMPMRGVCTGVFITLGLYCPLSPGN